MLKGLIRSPTLSSLVHNVLIIYEIQMIQVKIYRSSTQTSIQKTPTTPLKQWFHAHHGTNLANVKPSWLHVTWRRHVVEIVAQVFAASPHYAFYRKLTSRGGAVIWDSNFCVTSGTKIYCLRCSQLLKWHVWSCSILNDTWVTARSSAFHISVSMYNQFLFQMLLRWYRNPRMELN